MRFRFLSRKRSNNMKSRKRNSIFWPLKKSAIGNKNLRSFNRRIRDEYQKLLPGMKLKLYFVFGKRPTGMEALEKELAEFDDLIIANFSDEYNNLPLKVGKSLEYPSKYEFLRLLRRITSWIRIILTTVKSSGQSFTMMIQLSTIKKYSKTAFFVFLSFFSSSTTFSKRKHPTLRNSAAYFPISIQVLQFVRGNMASTLTTFRWATFSQLFAMDLLRLFPKKLQKIFFMLLNLIGTVQKQSFFCQKISFEPSKVSQDLF